MNIHCTPPCVENEATNLPDAPPVPTPGGGPIPGTTADCCSRTTEWQFQTQTTEPPGARAIRLDNADKTLATKMWITKASSPGDDLSAYVMANAMAGKRIYFKELDDSDTNAIYTVTGPVVDKGTYLEVPITHTATLPNQRVSLTILP